MDIGKKIINVINKTQKETGYDIQVYVSQSLLEKDPVKSAKKVFSFYEMNLYPQSILIYINKRNRKFTFICNEEITKKVSRSYFNTLSEHFGEDLLSTRLERALLILLTTLQITLPKKPSLNYEQQDLA